MRSFYISDPIFLSNPVLVPRKSLGREF
jgi:hypothetical protein